MDPCGLRRGGLRSSNIPIATAKKVIALLASQGAAGVTDALLALRECVRRYEANESWVNAGVGMRCSTLTAERSDLTNAS